MLTKIAASIVTKIGTLKTNFYFIFDREDALAVQGITLMAGKELSFSKTVVFRHKMIFPVSFWTLLFVTIS